MSNADLKTEGNITTKILKTDEDETTFFNDNKFMSVETDRLPETGSS